MARTRRSRGLTKEEELLLLELAAMYIALDAAEREAKKIRKPNYFHEPGYCQKCGRMVNEKGECPVHV